MFCTNDYRISSEDWREFVDMVLIYGADSGAVRYTEYDDDGNSVSAGTICTDDECHCCKDW